eukprot:CAMPEP_0179257584 /NCGR_PEP_ID=MMETSP0797-20121207/24864_1 /TAXON_ID=47934 /ORGANISM="Dinophysis acuminata, Strain DAEP01" /LENGTH=361 /DNA_ID=CAMNT_0020965567 /DNA_START=61 /DNA_END=1144 /DNA_ORIENTATION=+
MTPTSVTPVYTKSADAHSRDSTTPAKLTNLSRLDRSEPSLHCTCPATAAGVLRAELDFRAILRHALPRMGCAQESSALERLAPPHGHRTADAATHQRRPLARKLRRGHDPAAARLAAHDAESQPARRHELVPHPNRRAALLEVPPHGGRPAALVVGPARGQRLEEREHQAPCEDRALDRGPVREDHGVAAAVEVAGLPAGRQRRNHPEPAPLEGELEARVQRAAALQEVGPQVHVVGEVRVLGFGIVVGEDVALLEDAHRPLVYRDLRPSIGRAQPGLGHARRLARGDHEVDVQAPRRQAGPSVQTHRHLAALPELADALASSDAAASTSLECAGGTAAPKGRSTTAVNTRLPGAFARCVT